MKTARFLLHPVAPLLFWALLAGAADGSEIAGDGAGNNDRQLADQLNAALVAQGWQQSTADDGSTILRRRDDASRRTPAGHSAEMQNLAERLRRQLVEQGWTANSTDDGNTYYLPPQPASTPTPVNTPAEQLRTQLEAQRWEHSKAPDGSDVYRAPGVQHPAAPSAGPSLAEHLRGQLEAQGWIGSTAIDGSTIYRMPGTGKVVPTPSGADEWNRRLRDALEARGWSAAPAEGGGVLFVPAQRPPSAVDEPRAGQLEATSSGDRQPSETLPDAQPVAPAGPPSSSVNESPGDAIAVAEASPASSEPAAVDLAESRRETAVAAAPMASTPWRYRQRRQSSTTYPRMPFRQTPPSYYGYPGGSPGWQPGPWQQDPGWQRAPYPGAPAMPYPYRRR